MTEFILGMIALQLGFVGSYLREIISLLKCDTEDDEKGGE